MNTLKKCIAFSAVSFSLNVFSDDVHKFDQIAGKLEGGEQVRVGIDIELCKDAQSNTPNSIFDNGIITEQVYFTPVNALISREKETGIRLITLATAFIITK